MSGIAFSGGAAQRDVTPPVGMEITHYVRESKGVRDPLFVRALYLADRDGHEVALVPTDLIAVSFEVADELRARIQRELGIPQTLITASHSHASRGLGAWNNDETPEDQWNNGVIESILESVREAKEVAEPVTLRVGRAEGQVGFNRFPHLVAGLTAELGIEHPQQDQKSIALKLDNLVYCQGCNLLHIWRRHRHFI